MKLLSDLKCLSNNNKEYMESRLCRFESLDMTYLKNDQDNDKNV